MAVATTTEASSWGSMCHLAAPVVAALAVAALAAVARNRVLTA